DGLYLKKGLKEVTKALTNSQVLISEILMNQIWEELFYAYWMKLALVITIMVHHCSDNVRSLIFIGSGWYTLSRKWTRIDFLRIDKFMSLVRHLMHQCLNFLILNSWDTSLCQSFSNLFLDNNPGNADNQPQGSQVLFCDPNNRGLVYYSCDIFMDELIKVCSVAPNQHLQAEKKKTKKSLQKQMNNNNNNIDALLNEHNGNNHTNDNAN
ncbi:hypothetical protein RFI_34101, partial [Reticulomyxa filosa]